MAGVTGRRYWSLEEQRATLAERSEVGMSDLPRRSGPLAGNRPDISKGKFSPKANPAEQSLAKRHPSPTEK
jgi:hypothetical protein